MTKLIIVRHCQAEGNLKRFFQGRINSDITPKGKEQIAAVSELLRSEPIDIFYTSSLMRAGQTTAGINQYHNAPVIIDDRLAEIDAGMWEGQLLSDIAVEFPESFDNWNNDPAAFAAPGGESMAQVYERVSAAVDDIVMQNKGKTICIVSHGCAIKNMMCYLSGNGFSRIKETPIGTNTSVNVVTFDDKLRPTVTINNYSGHLEHLK